MHCVALIYSLYLIECRSDVLWYNATECCTWSACPHFRVQLLFIVNRRLSSMVSLRDIGSCGRLVSIIVSNDWLNILFKLEQEASVTWMRDHTAYDLVGNVLCRGCQQFLQLHTGETCDNWVLLAYQIQISCFKLIILLVECYWVTVIHFSFFFQGILNQATSSVEHLLHSCLHLGP